ncbi:MAG: 30S ribosomal protein S8 [Anaerolineae bacterium]
MQNDPIADMLTRIRNALAVQRSEVAVPSSKVKIAITRILEEEGYIEGFDVIPVKPQEVIRIRLKYTGTKRDREPVVTGLKRVSSPGRRVYSGKDQIPRVLSGIGVAILSTPSGVMTDRQARRARIGGEVLCYVW